MPQSSGLVICGNSEFREWPNSIGGCSAGVAINSAFGLRVSGLEWPGPTLEQPWRKGARSAKHIAFMRLVRLFAAILFSLCVAYVAALSVFAPQIL